MMFLISLQCHVPHENHGFDYSSQFESHMSSHPAGKGLLSSTTPCATPSACEEPEAQRSDQSAKGHPLYTS